MLARIKYKLLEDNNEKIIDAQISCKPNIEDYIFIDGVGSLMITRVTVVCRLAGDKNMKRPDMMLTCTKQWEKSL